MGAMLLFQYAAHAEQLLVLFAESLKWLPVELALLVRTSVYAAVALQGKESQVLGEAVGRSILQLTTFGALDESVFASHCQAHLAYGVAALHKYPRHPLHIVEGFLTSRTVHSKLLVAKNHMGSSSGINR